jgi:hypothetical protein
MLSSLISRSGGLAGPGAVNPFVKALGSFETTQARILPLAVLNQSKPSLLADFMAAGGVDVLAVWMLQADGEDGGAAITLLRDSLKLLQQLPATKAFVRSTKSARVLVALKKHVDKAVSDGAVALIKAWKEVMGISSSASSTKAGGRWVEEGAGRVGLGEWAGAFPV